MNDKTYIPSTPTLGRTLQRKTLVTRPLGEAFEFFADPRNLESLTPPWLSFRILTPLPVLMRAGLRIDYRIALHGLPLAWQSEITAWEPPRRFVDEQRRGPYRLWVHEHLFREHGSGTEIVDQVRYAAPGGRLIERFFVDRDLARIFDYRQRRIAALLNASAGKPGATGAVAAAGGVGRG
jgi:ligand-binding SRPBCC domain-containing protein